LSEICFENEMNDAKRNTVFHQNTLYIVVDVCRTFYRSLSIIHWTLSVVIGTGPFDVHNNSFIFTWLALLLPDRSYLRRTRSGAVGLGTALKTVRSRVRFSMVSVLPAAPQLWGW